MSYTELRKWLAKSIKRFSSVAPSNVVTIPEQGLLEKMIAVRNAEQADMKKSFYEFLEDHVELANDYDSEARYLFALRRFRLLPSERTIEHLNLLKETAIKGLSGKTITLEDALTVIKTLQIEDRADHLGESNYFSSTGIEGVTAQSALAASVAGFALTLKEVPGATAMLQMMLKKAKRPHIVIGLVVLPSAASFMRIKHERTVGFL